MNEAPIVSAQDLVRVFGEGDAAVRAIAGVVAAIGPARRASRLDVLEALAYE